MAFPIIDLRPDTEEPIDQATSLFLDAFRNGTED